MQKIRKALTFRASSIGDCLMGKYLLENIHAQFPDARCGIVVASRGSMIRDLLAGYPWIEVIEANRRSPGALWRLWREWRGSDFVVTQYAGKHGGQFGLASKLVARLLSRRGRFIGFADAFRWNSFLYDKLLSINPAAAVAEHERETLRAAGLSVPLAYPTLSTDRDVNALSKFKVTPGRYLMVHLYSGSAKRGLSPARRMELISKLAEAMPSFTLLISGGKGDLTEAQESSQGVTTARVIAGDASLQEMIELVAHAACTVSLDTGVAHLAAQMHRPVVVLRTCLGPNWWFPEQYGPDAPVRQFSREDLCTPHVSKNYPDCLDMIAADDVLRALGELLGPVH